MAALSTWILAMMCLFFFAGAMENSTDDKISSLSRSDEVEWNKHAVTNPDDVADEVLALVEMSVRNHTERRKLGYFTCGTGNPIDDCWRCDRNWHKNRKRLADCGIGFGRNAIGGRDGRFYVVTDPRDDNPVNPRPGTLRHAVIQDRPLWIVFKRDMVMLLGHSDSYMRDKAMQVTIAYNHFGVGLIQRMPRCRHGYFHVVNNDYTHWEMYAIGGSANPTINSQGNRYAAPKNPFAKEVTKRVDTPASHWRGWNWRSEGDLLQNGAYFTSSGAAASGSYARASSLAAKSSSLVATITSDAGALPCRRGRQCSS
ncbi:unnamed protein product [Thlaspi arvense]|uniref:Pectate lyase n=1 Tax=Thlaspi arvense TaxID=13288 RepID=A0AAU9RIY4_THLAR|nr:unnamed protein product [Thlaspi arvense]